MIHPSYVELMKVVNEETALVGEEPVVNSRYSIVCATAKRARQIIDGQEPMISGAYDMKPLSIAVKELYEGKLKILTDEEAAAKAKAAAEAKAKEVQAAAEKKAAEAKAAAEKKAKEAKAKVEEKTKYTLAVDGEWGKLTTITTQHVLGVEEDGILGPVTTKAIQKKVGSDPDGDWGPATTKAMQKFLGVMIDGIKGPETVKAWQTWCNKQL